MTQVVMHSPLHEPIVFLSRLLLPPVNGFVSRSSAQVKLKREAQAMSRGAFDDLLRLAQSNHVAVRGLEALLRLVKEDGGTERIEWVERSLAEERARIKQALAFLHRICAAFEERKYEAIVIKSLDHRPDFGSDLDLYTNANENNVLQLMRECFGAQVAPRSLGDRLANKWNFLLTGLPEAVEVHIGRLGQTGEQLSVATGLTKRHKTAFIDGSAFRIPSTSDRVMISTLQRMYRHFFFRLCDVLDTASLADANRIDYQELCCLARTAGIWEGVATYLAIVSDYVESYRGSGLDLPGFVNASARFRGDEVYFSRGFLRVPIIPQSARLYGTQLARVLAKGEMYNGIRLGLLPLLATMAVVGQKLTGCDKGIW